jgi:hypothetical protein
MPATTRMKARTRPLRGGRSGAGRYCPAVAAQRLSRPLPADRAGPRRPSESRRCARSGGTTPAAGDVRSRIAVVGGLRAVWRGLGGLGAPIANIPAEVAPRGLQFADHGPIEVANLNVDASIDAGRRVRDFRRDNRRRSTPAVLLAAFPFSDFPAIDRTERCCLAHERARNAPS